MSLNFLDKPCKPKQTLMPFLVFSCAYFKERQVQVVLEFVVLGFLSVSNKPNKLVELILCYALLASRREGGVGSVMRFRVRFSNGDLLVLTGVLTGHSDGNIQC